MEAEQTIKRKRRGRPIKPVKKETITGVRFTKAEYFIVKQKALKAGLGITVYLRQMGLQGQVIARMNEEERQFIRELVGMSNNLNQLARKAHREGLLIALLFFENYRNQLDALLQKMKK